MGTKSQRQKIIIRFVYQEVFMLNNNQMFYHLDNSLTLVHETMINDHSFINTNEDNLMTEEDDFIFYASV